MAFSSGMLLFKHYSLVINLLFSLCFKKRFRLRKNSRTREKKSKQKELWFEMSLKFQILQVNRYNIIFLVSSRATRVLQCGNLSDLIRVNLNISRLHVYWEYPKNAKSPDMPKKHKYLETLKSTDMLEISQVLELEYQYFMTKWSSPRQAAGHL